jgi:hypothetical protein
LKANRCAEGKSKKAKGKIKTAWLSSTVDESRAVQNEGG